MKSDQALISFDIEEWFHVLDTDVVPDEATWHSLPSRAPSQVDRILQLLSDRSAHATFFVLGWFARRHPQIVREIAASGHEIASHSDRHPLLYRLDRRATIAELRSGKDALEQQIGAPVRGFRAPGFSIRHDNRWALDCVAEVGFSYDSSLFPAPRAHGGMPGTPPQPHLLRTDSGFMLAEVPVSTLRVFGRSIAFGGGGYFRLAPLALTLALARRCEREGRPFVNYIHPRDLDRDTPRLPLSAWRTFKSYVGVRGALLKLEGLLDYYTPVPFTHYLIKSGLLPAP